MNKCLTCLTVLDHLEFFLREKNIENKLTNNYFLLILEIFDLHASMTWCIFKIKGQVTKTM